MKRAELNVGLISAERRSFAARVISVLQKSTARRARRLMPIESSDGASSGALSKPLSTAELKKSATKNTSRSRLETRLEQQIQTSLSAYLMPEREIRWHPKRMWRSDFVWKNDRLAVEVEGGIWSNGRHTRGKGFQADIEKYNEALLAGWRVLRVTKLHIDNGKAIEWIERALLEGYA